MLLRKAGMTLKKYRVVRALNIGV